MSIFRDTTRLRILDLSFNKMADISPLKCSILLYDLSLSHNNICDIQIISNLSKLIQLRLSFNNVNSIQNVSFERDKINVVVFIDKSQIFLFEKRKNHKIIKKKSKYIFLRSLFVVIEQELEYHDCDQTLAFIKRNIHLNLFYFDQVDSFFDKCRRMDLDLDF